VTAARAGLILLLLSVSTPAAAEAQQVDFMAKLVARSFVQALLSGEISATLPLCARTVNLDGQRVSGPKQLTARLERMSRRARQHGLRLEKLHLLPYTAAVKRYGPPPERLKADLARGRKVVALARFNNLGAALFLRRTGQIWKVIAVTD
jgi:hypothetical protein